VEARPGLAEAPGSSPSWGRSIVANLAEMRGGWRMVDGGRQTADGGWRTADGGRRMADGGRRMADGRRMARAHRADDARSHMVHRLVCAIYELSRCQLFVSVVVGRIGAHSESAEARRSDFCQQRSSEASVSRGEGSSFVSSEEKELLPARHSTKKWC
jgi:hypothetical protein